VWFQLIHLLDVAAGHDPQVFRELLVGFLSAADVGIFWVLWRKFGRLAATLFFWNPVSIMITGFNNQQCFWLPSPRHRLFVLRDRAPVPPIFFEPPDVLVPAGGRVRLPPPRQARFGITAALYGRDGGRLARHFS